MKKGSLAYCVLLVLFLAALPQRLSGAVEVRGIITGDTTWTNADTILVTGSVTVNSTAVLTIEAGTVILFNYNFALEMYGELAANGICESRIVFSTSADTAGGSPVAGRWQGVRFRPGSSGTFRCCDLRYATYNLSCDNSPIELHGCILENFSLYGVYFNASDTLSRVQAIVDSSAVRQSHPNLVGKGTGINIYGSLDAAIRDCRISNCGYGLRIFASHGFAPDFLIEGCDIRDNALYGIQMSYG